jgi:paraquat-inducible protein B
MTQYSADRSSHVSAEPEPHRRRFSPIWALPIVALIIAAWLGYTTFAERGPTITITFTTAAGLEPGKTHIKYHDIELGVVERVDPTPDLKKVNVTAQMSKMAAPHLKEGNQFWVVRPRFSLTSLSGLETLVSGAYIEMDPGSGNPARDFTGLAEPPVVRSDVPGTTFMLSGKQIGSIDSGAPVFYRGIDVGEVISTNFKGMAETMTMRIFVRKPYDDFVRPGTRFWNASGIGVSTSGGGFKLEVESLQAVLTGGIAFETPPAAANETMAKADTTFDLYSDRAAAEQASFTMKVRALVEFEGSVRGLEVGAPVTLRGMTIGRVADVRLVIDAATHTVRVPVVIEIGFPQIGIINQTAADFGQGKLAEQLVKLGLRAQLGSASLITGQLLVAFDFFPDAPPAEITKTDDGMLQLPTVPSTMEDLQRSVAQILDKVAALPLDQLTGDLRNALAAAKQLLNNTDTRSASVITSLHQTSDAAETVLKSIGTGYGNNSQIRGELSDLLKQLQDTARAVRVLASYLEQHPNSLIVGKAGGS